MTAIQMRKRSVGMIGLLVGAVLAILAGLSIGLLFAVKSLFL